MKTKVKKMTKLQHRKRHEKLHKMLDELVSDWIDKTGKLPSYSSVFELMEWSHSQTFNPTTERASITKTIMLLS